jgi:hypothetical protein
MKIERSRSKASKLDEKIEILRDISDASQDIPLPPIQDAENPLHILSELVERLEALEEISLGGATPSDVDTASAQERSDARKSYMSQVDHYLTLFQKQSAVLRRISSKLN